MKHFIYVTNDRLVGLLIKGSTVVEREAFALADADSPAVGEYLQRHRAIPTFVVTDLIEEDFRLDTIPHLRGGDQEAVIARKLAQVYRASPYRHAIVQGRAADGRRDDKVFYHAITNADLLRPLLVQLEEKQIPLEGIYSSAVLSGRMLEALDLFFTHTLLVTIVPDFGLRQTYFQNKLIKFSRLTPIIYDESRQVGQSIAAETSRTWQYLDSLRYFGSEESLEVCILLHERDRITLQSAIASFPLLRYRFLDINEVASKLGAGTAPTSSHAEEVFCRLFAQTRIENHFAEKPQMRFALFRRARMAVFAATAVVLAAGAIGAGFNLFQAARITTEIERRTNQERTFQAEHQLVLNSIRQQKAATDIVRDSAIFYNSQVRPAPAAPGALLRDIADVTAGFSRVSLLQLVWATGNDPTFTPHFQRAELPGTLAIISNSKAGVTNQAQSGGASVSPISATAPNLGDTNPPLPGNKYHFVIIDAAISPFDGNFRKVLDDIDTYQLALQKLPGVNVKVLSLPIDIGPGASMKVVDRLPSESGNAAARFTFKLVKTVPGT